MIAYIPDSDSESTEYGQYEPSEYALLELTKRESGGVHPTRTHADPSEDRYTSEDWPEVGRPTRTDADPSEESGGIHPTRTDADIYSDDKPPIHYTKKRGRSRACIEAATAEHIDKQPKANRVCNVNPYRPIPFNVNPWPTPPTSSQKQHVVYRTPSQAKRKTIYLEAACRVELLLAHHPPPAHCAEGTFGALLWRLCVTADTDMVPGELRKFASHCGGVPPSAKLRAFTDTPMLADPGNHCYAAVVARLLRHVAEHEPEAYVSLPHWGAQMLHKMGEEKVGDVCEAVLAAASAAADREQGRSHRWETLRGGAAPAADASVPLLVRLISWQTMRQ